MSGSDLGDAAHFMQSDELIQRARCLAVPCLFLTSLMLARPHRPCFAALAGSGCARGRPLVGPGRPGSCPCGQAGLRARTGGRMRGAGACCREQRGGRWLSTGRRWERYLLIQKTTTGYERIARCPLKKRSFCHGQLVGEIGKAPHMDR